MTRSCETSRKQGNSWQLTVLPVLRSILSLSSLAQINLFALLRIIILIPIVRNGSETSSGQ
jgi:hypothetical protein